MDNVRCPDFKGDCLKLILPLVTTLQVKTRSHRSLETVDLHIPNKQRGFAQTNVLIQAYRRPANERYCTFDNSLHVTGP